MCGRFASFLPAEALARIFGATNPLPNLALSRNVAPTNDAAVVRHCPETGARHLDLLKWGLLPYWTKEPTRAQRPINARSETAPKSGMFRCALERRRCLVPADAFYEWKVVEGGKQPYAIARQDGQPIAFVGLWESFRWPDQTVTRSFTILTTTPNAEMAELHDRMPVILEQQDWPTWLGEAGATTWRCCVLHPMDCCACGRSIVASARRGTTGRSCWRASPRRRMRRGERVG
jgi:putative SOS response-associated peptidase YedK